jgi:hypothetical protein
MFKEIPVYRDDMFSEYLIVGAVLSLLLAWILSALDTYTGEVVGLYTAIFFTFGALASYTRRYALSLGKGPSFPTIRGKSKPWRAIFAGPIGFLGIAASGLLTSNLSFGVVAPLAIFSTSNPSLLVVNTEALILYPAGGVVEQWGFDRWLTAWLLEKGLPIFAVAPIKGTVFTVYHFGVYG